MSAPQAQPAPLERASAFVAAHGERFERLFLEALLDPSRAGTVLREIEARQESSGAIGPLGAVAESAEEAGLESTMDALSILDALERLDAPVVEAAAAFLSRRQRADGSWGDREVDPDARVVVTGEVCGLLAKTTCVRPSVLDAAAAFLAARWSAERVRAGDFAAIAAYFHALANFPTELGDEALQWCGRELERGYRTRRFDALRTSRVFVRCGARALPGARLMADELLSALLAAQRPDGGWPGPTTRRRVDATLGAALALARLADAARPLEEPRC